MNTTVLKDTLYNLSPHSGGNAEYARGILVGTVAGLMSQGMTWEDAIHLCSDNAPDTVIPGCIPPTWQREFGIDPFGDDTTTGPEQVKGFATPCFNDPDPNIPF